MKVIVIHVEMLPVVLNSIPSDDLKLGMKHFCTVLRFPPLMSGHFIRTQIRN